MNKIQKVIMFSSMTLIFTAMVGCGEKTNMALSSTKSAAEIVKIQQVKETSASSVNASVFTSSFEINDDNIKLNEGTKLLNVDGHVYVPIRFVAESFGATIDYDAESHKIIIKNKKLDLIDPDYKGIVVGNLILTKLGTKTRVTGHVSMLNIGNAKNKIKASLAFYNDNSELIGHVIINGDGIGVIPEIFVSEGLGDFRAYSTVNLHLDVLNNQITPKASTTLYESNKHKFTLNIPENWEGKYDITEYDNGVTFTDKANKTYGGLLFNIRAGDYGN